MVAGFELVSDIGTNDVMETHRGKASTQYTANAAMQFINGILQHIDAIDDVVTHVFSGMTPDKSVLRPVTENLTTALREEIKAVPVFDLIFGSDILGTGDADQTVNAAGTTTTARIAALGYGGEAANDFRYGQIYLVEQDFQAYISADAFSGGNHTFTFEPAAPRAVANGDKIRILPFSPGDSPKLMATTPQLGISNLVADKSGGKTKITKVKLKNKRVENIFLRS